MNLVAYLLARLKEPSSHAGIAALLAAAGISLPDPLLQASLQLVMAILGFVAVLVPEKSAAARLPSKESGR